MDGTTVQRLLALNRQFYAQFAEPFAQSRGFEQPGIRRALDFLPSSGRLLDVGCGNGRLAHVLERADRALEYIGIDSSARLLAIARRQAASLHSVQAPVSYTHLDVYKRQVLFIAHDRSRQSNGWVPMPQAVVNTR